MTQHATGQIITWTVTLRNTGNVDLTNVVVVDPKATGLSCPSSILVSSPLVTCTGTYTVNQTDLDSGGKIINTATVTSTQTPTPQSASAAVDVTQAPQLNYEKTANRSSVDAVGRPRVGERRGTPAGMLRRHCLRGRGPRACRAGASACS